MLLLILLSATKNTTKNVTTPSVQSQILLVNNAK